MSLLDPNFVWRSSAATDVTITWRKFGWTPISERTDHEADRIKLRHKGKIFDVSPMTINRIIRGETWK